MVDGVCPACGERDPWSVPFPTISDLRAQIEVLENDVLTAWRVRNAALAVAATFIHNGPDYEDEQARKRLVEEWVGDGHDRVEEENRQRLVAIQRMIAAERAVEDLRALTLGILGHINEKGHPGQECLRSGWIPVGMVADWRSQVTDSGREGASS